LVLEVFVAGVAYGVYSLNYQFEVAALVVGGDVGGGGFYQGGDARVPRGLGYAPVEVAFAEYRGTVVQVADVVDERGVDPRRELFPVEV